MRLSGRFLLAGAGLRSKDNKTKNLLKKKDNNLFIRGILVGYHDNNCADEGVGK